MARGDRHCTAGPAARDPLAAERLFTTALWPVPLDIHSAEGRRLCRKGRRVRRVAHDGRARRWHPGADLLKVAVEDGIAGRNDLPVLSAEALAAVVAAAHERGKVVSAHLTDARFLQAVVDAGVDDAAHVCGLEQELGTIEAGKSADLLVVNGDPLRDLNALLNVRLVVRRGVIIRH